MRIAITNDDGIESPGIHALAAACASLGHDVVVIAPPADMSGSSAAIGRISFAEPTPLRRVELPAPAAGISAYVVDGPPGLAALIACQGGVGEPPELVLSGINAGPNTGHSILHSGTVGAALTAASFGVSAVAISLDIADPMPWASAADVVPSVLELAGSAPVPTVLNVNVPAAPARDVQGPRWATLDHFGSFRVAVAEREDTWVQMEYRSTGANLDPTSDTALLAAGYATVTAIEGIGELPAGSASLEPGHAAPVPRLTEVPRRPPSGPGVRTADRP